MNIYPCRETQLKHANDMDDKFMHAYSAKHTDTRMRFSNVPMGSVFQVPEHL